MATKGKRKTTMAKLAREAKLREQRAVKKAKKDARKLNPPDYTAELPAIELESGVEQADPAELVEVAAQA